MNSAVGGGARSRWVGPPVPAPLQSADRGRPPSGRQRHYGAVELAGSGEQVYVNDVVRVSKRSDRPGTSQDQPHRLAQVQCMWEDILTGIFKFHARWLIYTSDLTVDSLKVLQKHRLASGQEGSSSIGNVPVTSGNAKRREDTGNTDMEEVFLTPKTEDLEIRLIKNPITLSVPTNATTDIPAEWKGKTGPRLAHSFDKSTGEFAVLDGSDAILKRARARQSEAVAIAARADHEYEAAKNGKPIGESNGWMLPKGAVYGLMPKGKGKGTDKRQRRAPSSSSTAGRGRSIANTIGLDGESDDGKREDATKSSDQEWKASDDHGSDTTDSDFDGVRRVPSRTGRGVEASPRKSPRQRKAQQSPADSSEVNIPTSQLSQTLPGPSSSQRRTRAPATKRQGPLPPRPRRLSMPPMADRHASSINPHGGTDGGAVAPIAANAVRPARTRAATGNLRRSCSVGSMGEVARESPALGKRRRGGAAGGSSKNSLSQSDYPPRRTPVGKCYQVDIPELVYAEEKEGAAAATGARMVWRSARDWDPHSRRMLDEYLNAAKEVVQAKQARPGVPVHVRLGGGDESGDGDSMESTGSYAVWAVTAGRDACGVVRVACSEAAQTEVPRSAIQRVQSEEEALTALVKTRCILDNFEPALEMLSNNQASPPSIQPWTLMQVRTLEKVLEREFDPNRRLHGYARPGMDMDREDFIDLASVSKQVPGKTPAQVLSFYYRYLAAAEPLTDVVYGAEAAEARKQEELSSVRDAELAPVWNGLPVHGDARGTQTRLGTQQASNGQHDSSSVGGACEPAVIARQQATKMSPNTTQSGVAKSELGNVSDADDSQRDVKRPPRDAISAERDLAPHPYPLCNNTKPSSDRGAPQGDLMTPARDGSTPQRDSRHLPRGGSEHPYDDDTSAVHGGGRRRVPADDDRAEIRQETEAREAPGASLGGRHAANGWKGTPGGLGGGKEQEVEQRRRMEREAGAPKTLPPDAEVLEVDDSGDEAGADAHRRGPTRRLAPSAMGVRPPSRTVAASRFNAMGQGELPWMARQTHRQSEETLAAVRSQRSGALLRPHQPLSEGASCGVAGSRMARPSYVSNGFRSDTVGFEEDPRGGRWEHPQQHPVSRGLYTRRGDSHVDASSGGRGGAGTGGRFISRFKGVYDGGHGSARQGHDVNASNERASDVAVITEETFGAMAPCWRLLERAKDYMDHDQLVYMRGLILTHVKKPMSRDQILERAESCLHEQEQIFAAFVKMYDRIEQPPLVPLYPATIRLPPESKLYSIRTPPSAIPVHADSPEPLHARVPPPRSVAVEVKSAPSRYPVSSPVRGGVAAGGRGVSPTASSPVANPIKTGKGRAEIRPHSMGLHAYGTGRRWMPKGNGYDAGGGGAPRQRVGHQIPSLHPSPPGPSSSVMTSRATVSGEARRDQGYNVGAGGERRGWGRADQDSGVAVYNKDMERGRSSAVQGYGGVPYGSRTPPGPWGSGDSSVAAVSAATEVARRGDGRAGSSWGNAGGAWA